MEKINSSEEQKVGASLFGPSNYIAVNVRTFPQAVHFYSNVLGLEVIVDPSEPECEATLKHGSMRIVLDRASSSSGDDVGRVCFEFITSNLDAAVSKLTQAGCKIGRSTSGELFRGQMVSDPYGMNFHLYE